MSRFEKKGFVLKGMKMFQCPKEVAEEHYQRAGVQLGRGLVGKKLGDARHARRRGTLLPLRPETLAAAHGDAGCSGDSGAL